MCEYNVNLDKIDRMAGLTFKNSIRLHFDSILLFNNASYSSAFFLSILALEELAKVYMLEDFLWHSRVEGRWGEKEDRKFLNSIYFHKVKQNWFTSQFFDMISKKFIKTIYSGNLETLKQNSVYVGLPKNKHKIDLKGKIINPLKISEEKAKNQITIMNDCLLELCLIIVKEVGCMDSYYAEDVINESLVDEIENKWEYISNVAKKRINQLKELV